MSEISGLMGLDRKAMEEERLRRLALKRGTTHQIEHERMTKVQRKGDEIITCKASQKSSGPTISSGIANKTLVPSTSDLRVDHRNGIQYRQGAFKKTWVFGHERVNDIKIEEVFQKHDLHTAVLSSFQWDIEWVFSKLDVTKTKLVLVMEAKDEATVSVHITSTRASLICAESTIPP